MKPLYNISIDFHDVGASVQVGCKRLAYTDLQQMVVDISAYVNDPAATIKVMQEQFPSLKLEEYRTRGPFVEQTIGTATDIPEPTYPFPRN